MTHLTTDQLQDAVRQMIAHCRMLMEQYRAGTRQYDAVSARSVLYKLGFEDSAEQVLQFIADGGFDYCLDAYVECNGETPPRSACYWGPDQLESRLQCLSNVSRVY